MAGVDFTVIRSSIGILTVLDFLGWSAVGGTGDQLRGGCPVHGSSVGSRIFSVNITRNCYRCFKCGSQGNQLDLWSAVHQISLYCAAVDLCETFGVEVPRVSA